MSKEPKVTQVELARHALVFLVRSQGDGMGKITRQQKIDFQKRLKAISPEQMQAFRDSADTIELVSFAHRNDKNAVIDVLSSELAELDQNSKFSEILLKAGEVSASCVVDIVSPRKTKTWLPEEARNREVAARYEEMGYPYLAKICLAR